MNLKFRAILPDGSYFYQRSQYLTSYLRRLLRLYGVSHEKYLDKHLEEYLEIKVESKWIKCKFNN